MLLTKMDVEEEEWVGHALQEAERRKCISKVLSIRRKDAVDKGNNYASDIYRLKVKVLTNSGEVEERSVMYKIIPVCDADKVPEIRVLEMFRVEARMYQETLATMGRLLKSKDPAEEPLWPEFYGVKGNYDAILLEDLSVHGYVMIDRLKGLDFQHASLALQNLAKFHALAAVVLDEGAANERDYLPKNFFLPNIDKVRETLGNLMLLLKSVIKEYWSCDGDTHLEDYTNLLDNLPQEVIAIYEKKDNIFKTLNHGDFWMNNFLFKYDSSGALMNSMRFIDYQVVFVHTPCYDIQYLFSTSLRLECSDKKLELLKLYHESLEKYLKLFGYKKTAPTFEELQRDLETTRLFGFFTTLTVYPFLRNPSVYELLEKYGGPDDDTKWVLPYRYAGEEFRTTIRITLQELRDLGLL